MKNDLKDIANYPIFSGLIDQEIELFTKLMTIKSVPAGSNIIKENDEGDSIILLLSGDASVSKALTLNTTNTVNDTREKEKE